MDEWAFRAIVTNRKRRGGEYVTARGDLKAPRSESLLTKCGRVARTGTYRSIPRRQRFAGAMIRNELFRIVLRQIRPLTCWHDHSPPRRLNARLSACENASTWSVERPAGKAMTSRRNSSIQLVLLGNDTDPASIRAVCAFIRITLSPSGSTPIA